jgi:hypothetical protein
MSIIAKARELADGVMEAAYSVDTRFGAQPPSCRTVITAGKTVDAEVSKSLA